jgi:hypothetical protein
MHELEQMNAVVDSKYKKLLVIAQAKGQLCHRL